MQLQGRELRVRMKGPDVELLQKELQQLGFAIPTAEAEEGFFGKDTRKTVQAFQNRHGLEPTGGVDERTARAINAAVDARQPERFIVMGQVRQQGGTPVPDVVVRAFDRDLRRQELLGETRTGTRGGYEIRYTAGQFRRAEKTRADLVVRAFDTEGQELAASETHFNAPEEAAIDLVVVPRQEPKPSEYEHLLETLAPILEDVQRAELTEEDLDFLVGEFAGDPVVEESRLRILAQAARLTQETGLPAEAFYGWGRLGFSLKLEALLDQAPEALRTALEKAIEKNIIPARLRESLDAIIARLEPLRFEAGLDETFEFFGQLRDEKTDDPLAGFTVRAFDLDAGAKALGHDIANAEGLFLITYTAPRPPQPEEREGEQGPTRRLRLHIVDPRGDEIHQAEIPARVGVHEVTEIRIPVPEVPDTSATLTDVAEASELEVPSELVSHLTENDIRTLDDIRKRGRISDLAGLPVAPDHPAVQALEAHANLSLLSRDVRLNAKLIDSGLSSLAAVARTPRARFVSNFHTDAGGDLKAFQLHTEAVATTHFLDNVVTGFVADIANGYKTPAASPGPDVFDVFQASCACKDCESAVSPLAYLADLLHYAVTHVQQVTGEDQGEPISLDFLIEQFHQPFGELRASCQTVEEELRQVRICIEALRRFIGSRPLADVEKEAALALAEREYRMTACQALPGAIGTSFDELRRARTADADTRTQLAGRLGIDPAHLNDLLLDLESVTEQDLERLFGLADTTRDPLSRGAKLGDTDDQITRWYFKGVEWNRNTDRDGRIYLSLTNPELDVFRLELFRDRDRTERVASGERASATGKVVLSQEAGSGLTGAVEINFVADAEEIEISVVPDLLSWRLDFLRSLWFGQDWPDPLPEDAYPLLDPDLVGPADLKYLSEDEPAFALREARRQQVDDMLAAIKAVRESDGLSAVVESRIGELAVLRLLREQFLGGQEMEEQITALGLQLPAFLRLLEIADVEESGEMVLESEYEEVDSILTQVQKAALFGTWIDEEVQAGIALSPDHFRIAPEEPEALPLWRATRGQRRQWQNRLRARIDQEQAVIGALHEAVDGMEESTLPMLRDALVIAADVEGVDLDAKAEWITRNLLIDARNNGCPRTTRIAQVIETVQGLLWSIRTGTLQDTLPDLQLDADNFYEEWEWLGSYETWRAAMSVFLYPENILLPSLRNRQTPGFRRLVKDLRDQNRLTPEQACHAARDYADYFGDVCSMNVEASCQADTRIHRGEGCRERTAVEYRYLVYHFGRGTVTTTLYWSAFDLHERCGDAQTYWEPVPGLQNVDAVIGAVPYRVSDDERYLCLFVRSLEDGRQKLKLTRYDLEEQRWDDEPTELDLPEDAQPRFMAVISQRDSESRAPRLAIRGASGAIYDRKLNRDATGWQDDDSEDHAENDGEWHVLVSRSRGREFPRLWAMVELDATHFYLLVQDRESHIRYRLFGPNGDGHWYPDPQSLDPGESRLAHAWKGEPVGAFLWPSNQLYVVWKKTASREVALRSFSGLQPEFEVGPVTTTYYQRVTSPEAENTLVIKKFRKERRDDPNEPIGFNEWLEDVAGISLKGTIVSYTDLFPEISLLDLFTLDLDDLDVESIPDFIRPFFTEIIYRQAVGKVIDAIEGNIRDNEGWKEWRFADVLVRRLSGNSLPGLSGNSLPDVLRTLFNNRDLDNPPEIREGAEAIRFRKRKDSLSERFIFSSGLDHIAPSVFASPRVGPIDPRLATRYRQSHAGPYQVMFQQQSNGQLRELTRNHLAPRCSGPMEITERLTDEQRALRRKLIKKAFLDNADSPPSHLTYLEEAYYFVPVHLALQLQRRGHYLAALDWFRTVFDYGRPEEERKIYFGLVQEEDLSAVYKRARNWLGDPLNPHAIAKTRAHTYTRFTILSLVRCLLDFGDAEFTRDTAGSVARARSLYLTALELLDTGVIKQHLNPCGAAIEELDAELAATIALEAPEWTPIWDEIILALGRIDDRKTLETAIGNVRAVLDADEPLEMRLIKARELVADVLSSSPPRPTMAEVLRGKGKIRGRTHPALLGSGHVFGATKEVSACARNDFMVAVTLATGLSTAELEEKPELPWLRQPLTAPAGVAGTPVNPTTTVGRVDGRQVHFNPIAPSHSTIVGELFRDAPLQATKLVKTLVWPFTPSTYSDFCVLPNPIVASLRLHAELNLYKIRTCRNIAGDERALEPYAAPISVESGLPMIGAGGQIVLPGTLVFRPTPYRYSALIERAKQLVTLAQQIEAAFLSALEKRDAEFFQLLRARQEVRLARAGVRLQNLRVKEAEDGVTLAQLQRERVQIQKDHFNNLLAEGYSSLERDAISYMIQAVGHHIEAAATGLVGAIASAFSPAGAGGFFGGISSTASSLAAAASAQAGYYQFLASLQRREQDWRLQRDLAEQDVRIGNQQIRLARDRVRVVGQKRMIAEMQAEHAETTADFLANKFTNVELYDWMSEILEGVYSFFLQQATAVARLAQSQLSFERQEIPPAIIQADYWEAPLGLEMGGITNGTSPDRRGLTGSARLLQDIFQLDQYAFETDRRKLQPTKTISLARLAPAEFQRFRETGVMRFATPMDLFDHDFPGHYLRLIKRVRTSVIALIPPTEGIKATLVTTGLSRVVINSGGAFQTTEVRRPPESIALTSPINATGLFELTPQPQEKLFPFESAGVDTAWEFQMPRAANLFDYRTIADVLLTIEYTALNSFDYRQQAIRELDRTISADRPFSFRQEFADVFYDLNNPDQSDTPMVVRFETRREDFAPNIDDLRIQQVVLFFARAEGTSFEVPVTHLLFTEQGSAGPVGGGATSMFDGVISTRRGNASSWTAMTGRSPFGAWELALPDAEEMFNNEEIEDILFVITYTGRTPAWPS